MKINIMGYSCCVPLHIYFIKTKPSRNVSSRSPKCCSCFPPSLDQDSLAHLYECTGEAIALTPVSALVAVAAFVTGQ